MFFCTVWAFLMPSVKHSIYFHTTNSNYNDQTKEKPSISNLKNHVEENSPKDIQEGNPEKKVKVQ